MTRATGPFDLAATPIHLGSRAGADDPATPLHGFGFDPPSFEAYIAQHCAPGAPGRLVMVESSAENWSAWECHTQGDEIVIVLAQHCAPGAPGRLVMVESSAANWSAWECHTQGDEIVIVLEGKNVFIQEIAGDERRTAVGPGVAIINPTGVWHTADVAEPLKAIYITPCPGTQHRPRR